jgi:transcriptional regulator with XRE-family HTH domain
MDAALGARLKDERKRLLLTQQNFGGIGGVEANAQAMYEKGVRSPKTDYLGAIWRIGVDIRYVLTAERYRLALGDLTVQETDLIQRYRSLVELDRDAVAQVVFSMSTKSFIP